MNENPALKLGKRKMSTKKTSLKTKIMMIMMMLNPIVEAEDIISTNI
jgi:hypothetical protein